MSSTPLSLVPQDRVKFRGEKLPYTVRAVTKGGRFAILTKPFNPRRTVLYTVIDFDRGVRGKDNYYGLGYETPEDIERALHNFQHTEDGDHGEGCEIEWCYGRAAEVSYRTANHIPLDIEQVLAFGGPRP